MHKKVIATAIAAGFAAAAAAPLHAAEDNNKKATFYGLIDVNLAYESAGNLKRRGLDHSELNGSRFGVKGSIGLDSNLSAIYVLEGGFDPGTGNSEQSKTLLGRQVYAGLEGGWGRLTAGRQYSPAFVALDPFEATGSSDRSAGMLHRKSGSVSRGYQVRFDNMLKYRSPEFAGFSVDAGYWLGKENSSENADVRNEGSGAGLTALYKNGPFAASLTTQSYYVDATGGKASTHGGGISYDLGVAKLYALVSQDKESGTAGTGKATSYAVSAEFRATKVDTIAVSYGSRDEKNEAGVEDATGWSLYYLHDLPQGATTLYAAYTHLANKEGANYGFNLTPAAGDDPTVVMVGVRHKF